MFPDNSVIISTSGATAWPFRQEDESPSTNWNGEIFLSAPFLPQSQLQTHAVNTAPICRIWYQAAVSAIQSGGKRVRLPLVLIAHRDPELDVSWSLDSIISMQQLQVVSVNIKFVGHEVHSTSTDRSWTGNNGNKKQTETPDDSSEMPLEI